MDNGKRSDDVYEYFLKIAEERKNEWLHKQLKDYARNCATKEEM
jgi:hypothetical protein